MTQLKFVVLKTENTRQWYWHSLPLKGGRLVGTMGESHKSRAYTIKRAKIMAHGRPVYLRDPKTGKETLVP